MGLLSLIGDLNAGVVEEIIIVAVPVLVGRRAGWHPAWVIAVSMVLRWPFHIYHGTWTSLPRAMIWGGANVAAFLYLRRLFPLVVVHLLNDALIGMGSAYGEVGRDAVLLLDFVLIAFLGWRAIVDQRRRLNPAAATTDTAVATFLLTHLDGSEKALFGAVGVLFAGALIAQFIIAPDLTIALASAGTLLVLFVAFGCAAWSAYRATNVIVRRNPAGAITGVIRWHTTYTGRSCIDTVTDQIDLLHAVGAVARVDHQPIVLSSGDHTRRARFIALGCYPATGRHPFRRIHLPAQRAADFGQTPEDHDQPPSAAT